MTSLTKNLQVPTKNKFFECRLEDWPLDVKYGLRSYLHEAIYFFIFVFILHEILPNDFSSATAIIRLLTLFYCTPHPIQSFLI